MKLGRRTLIIALAYLAVQAVVWAKSLYFFSLYGHGKSAVFSLDAFPAEALQFEHFFHNGVHVAIGVVALLFGMNLKRIDCVKLLAIVFIAVGLHNVGYWLTFSHPSPIHSIVDFTRDSLLLLAFIVAGFSLKKIFARRMK